MIPPNIGPLQQRGKNNIFTICCVLMLALLLAACTPAKVLYNGHPQNGFVPFDDPHLRYQGRIGEKKAGAAEFYWPGSSVHLRFRGTAIRALLEDYNGQNYFQLTVDDKPLRKIKIDSTRHWYLLAENLRPGTHDVEIFKLTQINKEYSRGFTRFYGFDIGGEKPLTVTMPAPKKSLRKMEFYGNSITCGHAVEDSSGNDSGASQFENNYRAYGAVISRHYNAQYSCIAVSGIGLLAGFRKAIMPEMYDLRNPFDSTDLWDFSKYMPGIVVVNLLENDEALIGRPEHEIYKKRFGTRPPTEAFIIQSYASFIRRLRGHYRQANIICVLGDMGITRTGSKWPGYVEQAVASLNDKKIYTHFFPYKGTSGHPRSREQQQMAESLIRFIDTNVRW